MNYIYGFKTIKSSFLYYFILFKLNVYLEKIVI